MFFFFFPKLNFILEFSTADTDFKMGRGSQRSDFLCERTAIEARKRGIEVNNQSKEVISNIRKVKARWWSKEGGDPEKKEWAKKERS